MTTVLPRRVPAASRGRRAAEHLREAAETTPGRHRLWSLGAALLLALALVAASASARQMRASTHTAETTTGPVLVATQQVVSSLAAADAAATAAFLSGTNEDPEQRRLYEQALARSGEQIEDIASLVGQDPTTRAQLGRIQVQLTRYAGLVEAARAANKVASPDANGYLSSAVRLAGQIVQGDVQALTTSTQADLRRDESGRTRWLALAALGLAASLVLLGAGQFLLARSSHRLLNMPLVAATLLALVALGWLGLSEYRSGSALASARRHGYDSIALTAQLGSAGFGAKAAETLAVITGDTAQRSQADSDARLVAPTPMTPVTAEDIRQGRSNGAPGGLIGQMATAAGNARQRAAVAETAQRWQRYEDTVAALRAAPNPAAARLIAEGQANAAFNGFNFSVESILGQNRGQFIDGLTSAANRTNRIPAGVVLLLLAAIAAMFWGYQLRIDDYR